MATLRCLLLLPCRTAEGFVAGLESLSLTGCMGLAVVRNGTVVDVELWLTNSVSEALPPVRRDTQPATGGTNTPIANLTATDSLPANASSFEHCWRFALVFARCCETNITTGSSSPQTAWSEWCK